MDAFAIRIKRHQRIIGTCPLEIWMAQSLLSIFGLERESGFKIGRGRCLGPGMVSIVFVLQ